MSTSFTYAQIPHHFLITSNRQKFIKLRQIQDEIYKNDSTYLLFTYNPCNSFLKLINIRNGLVLASSTHSADLTQEIDESNKVIIEKKPTVYQPMTL